MRGRTNSLLGLRALLAASLLAASLPNAAQADVATLKNGMQYEGAIGKIESLGGNPLNPQGAAGQIKVRQIVFVDDNLRRTFFSQIQVQSVTPSQTNLEKIRIEQPVAKGDRRLAVVGPILGVTPFDRFGRRTFTMNTSQGPVDVVQGITEVTPLYTKVEGLAVGGSYVWDMRIATSSIPRDTLSQILLKAIDPKNADQRLRLVRLYIQSERYTDAQAELKSVIAEFPDLANLQKQVTALDQIGAKRMIQEVERRRKSGQHRLAYSMLERFPSKGVAGELLLQVRDLLDEYKKLKQRGEQTLASLEADAAEIKGSKSRGDIKPILQEIKAQLNLANFDRMADYLRLSNDPALNAEQKVALAISGWLLGGGSGDKNFAVATSLVQVRQLVHEYMATSQNAQRDAILGQLASLEGSSPSYLAKLVAQMKPPLETPQQPDGPPGFYQLAVAGLTGEPDFNYLVQLPPEYDPYRRYPCVITLNGAGTTPQQQVDWWAGVFDKQAEMRLGQAARYGYIVLAPLWTTPQQTEYEYSAREHAAVLYPLRDACRRFSIDTDRVFLSGHSLGGDAAWDIGLAHPDLWAGVLPIVATAGKYVTQYWENGRYVPLYFVCGEMDGGKMGHNSTEFDRYLNKHSYDTTVVVYEGRGHEGFADEIHRMFAWMDLHRRQFFPKEFECDSMRPWDNFFWWAEFESLPARSVVLPVNWPPESGVRPARTEGHILKSNRVNLRTAAERAAVWLAPEMVDFSQHVTVSINGRTHNQGTEARTDVLLEDVRTRGDRQHPFWARVDDSR